MQTPPFRPALVSSAVTWVAEPRIPYGEDAEAPEPAADEAGAPARLRLADMDSHLHCSVIGTCLSTAELRRLMARHVRTEGASDLDVHHEAVRLAGRDAEVGRALHKALDRRHEAVVRRFAQQRDAAGLAELWQQSLKSGEVPGAYWAVLTHRRTTPELRQQVFGDVHMLSHLVGAANRADIRRLVALEQENAEWRERAERQQDRLAALIGARDQEAAARERLALRLAEFERQSPAADADEARESGATLQSLADAIALQTRRREHAEAEAVASQAEAGRLEQELATARAHAAELARELSAAEMQLRESANDGAEGAEPMLQRALAGRRLLYVGGRPSSNPAIRDLVRRHGGDYQRHDGGLEERKGLLASALAWADLVVFPVDCIDHDSALALKRSCQRQGTPFLPLRTASVASFVSAVTSAARPPAGDRPHDGPCLHHG